MLDKLAGAAGAVVVYWAKAEALIAAHPRLTLILWGASFVAGVWL